MLFSVASLFIDGACCVSLLGSWPREHQRTLSPCSCSGTLLQSTCYSACSHLPGREWSYLSWSCSVCSARLPANVIVVTHGSFLAPTLCCCEVILPCGGELISWCTQRCCCSSARFTCTSWDRSVSSLLVLLFGSLDFLSHFARAYQCSDSCFSAISPFGCHHSIPNNELVNKSLVIRLLRSIFSLPDIFPFRKGIGYNKSFLSASKVWSLVNGSNVARITEKIVEFSSILKGVTRVLMFTCGCLTFFILFCFLFQQGSPQWQSDDKEFNGCLVMVVILHTMHLAWLEPRLTLLFMLSELWIGITEICQQESDGMHSSLMSCIQVMTCDKSVILPRFAQQWLICLHLLRWLHKEARNACRWVSIVSQREHAHAFQGLLFTQTNTRVVLTLAIQNVYSIMSMCGKFPVCWLLPARASWGLLVLRIASAFCSNLRYSSLLSFCCCLLK